MEQRQTEWGMPLVLTLGLDVESLVLVAKIAVQWCSIG